MNPPHASFLAGLNRTSRAVALCVGGCLTLLTAAAAGAAVRFDIPAQPAAAALQLFGQQARVEVVYPAAELRKVQTAEVRGEMDPAAAIKQLLAGTGYSARQLSATNFAVARIEPGAIEGEVREDKTGKPVANAKVQLAGSGQSVLTDKRGRFVLVDVTAGSQVLLIAAEGMQNTRVTDVNVEAGHRLSLSPIGIPVAQSGTLQLDPFTVSAKKNDGVVELDPYSVTGSKQKPFQGANVDIPRTINDTQPYYVFDSRLIDQSGATNIEDFLKQRLTMNTISRTSGQTSLANGGITTDIGNSSRVNLRALGTSSTLILVNGRRMAGVSSGANNGDGQSTGQPDLNGIPLSAVDHIEVLPTSASGIYGGGAVGGVVNVVLKSNHSGGEIRATYSNTWDTDSPTRTASILYGASLEHGKTHFMISAQASDASPIYEQDRLGLFLRGYQTVLHNNPVLIPGYTVQFSPFTLGSLPTIYVQSGSLVLKNGMPLNSRFTFVPAGTSPSTPQSTLIAGLIANAGKSNNDLPPTLQSPNGLLRQFGSTPTTQSFNASIRRQMLPNIDSFADFAYNNNRTKQLLGDAYSGALASLSAASPFNPFNATVNYLVPMAGTTPYVAESNTRNLSVGVILSLPFDWKTELDYTWSQNRFNTDYIGTDQTSLLTAQTNGVLDPLVDTLLYPLKLNDYHFGTRERNRSDLDDYAVRAAGPLWSIPTGTPTLTIGLERRSTHTAANTKINDAAPARSQTASIMIYYPKTQKTDSAYLEANIPLVKPNKIAFVHSLEFQAAGRYEKFTVDAGTASSTFSPNSLSNPNLPSFSGPTLNGQPYFSTAKYDSLNHTLGLKYQPVDQITVRASFATAFLPPTSSQLIKNPVPNPNLTTISDPQMGVSYGVQTISGGNPDLTPQNSKTWNAGIIWAPSEGALTGLRIDAEYYKIKQFNAIGALSAQLLVANEATFPDRVTRSSSGVITLLDLSSLNLYKLETEGWDITLNYRTKALGGTFDFSAVESILLHSKTQFSLTLPEYDSVGSPNEGGGAKYKSVGTLVWEREKWSVGWTTTYVSSYKQYGAVGGPIFAQFGVEDISGYIKGQGSDTVSSQTYHDIFATYVFGGSSSEKERGLWMRNTHGLLSNTTVQVGVKNVFNTWPPFDAFQGATFFISPYGDFRLRTVWVSLKKSF